MLPASCPPPPSITYLAVVFEGHDGGQAATDLYGGQTCLVRCVLEPHRRQVAFYTRVQGTVFDGKAEAGARVAPFHRPHQVREISRVLVVFGRSIKYT